MENSYSETNDGRVGYGVEKHEKITPSSERNNVYVQPRHSTTERTHEECGHKNIRMHSSNALKTFKL